MASIVYPFTLTAGQPENVAQLNSNLSAVTAQVNGNLDDTNLATALATVLGVSQAGTVRRGKSIITASESRTNTAYGLMSTPDRVSSVVLPTSGLIAIGYQARWESSVSAAGLAAIFIGSNQLKAANPSSGSSPVVQEVQTTGLGANWMTPLVTTTVGLAMSAPSPEYTADVTTGQILGLGNSQGALTYVFAAAGTYDITIQFKATSGSVTVADRKLWVEARGY
jgi:hypothetical protein